MFKLYVNSRVPKHLEYQELSFIKAKETYMGVHRTIVRNDIDVMCTKTALFGFIKESDANKFQEVVNRNQRKNLVLSRDISENDVIKFEKRSEHPAPYLYMTIEKIPKQFIIYTCLMQYFDLYIIDGVMPSKKEPNTWNIYGYELRTDNVPSRNMIVQMYEHMLL